MQKNRVKNKAQLPFLFKKKYIPIFNIPSKKSEIQGWIFYRIVHLKINFSNSNKVNKRNIKNPVNDILDNFFKIINKF